MRAIDVSVGSWDPALVEWADEIAFSVPMHTAARLARAGAEVSTGPSVVSGSTPTSALISLPSPIGRPGSRRPASRRSPPETSFLRSIAMPTSRSVTSYESWAAWPRVTGARTAVGTVRSQWSTTDGSAGWTRARCSPTSRSWWSWARDTSPSAIPISSTHRRTQCASCVRCTSASPTSRSTAP